MKHLRILTAIFLLLLSLGNSAYAQSEESRTKIEMTISFGGKAIVAELSSLSTAISRGYDDAPSLTPGKDTVKKSDTTPKPGSVYLTMEVKKISDDLIRVFSKKQNRFDGTITIVDTYGKFPPRTFKFKGATLSSYSEQASAFSYGDNSSPAYLSITSPEVTINGIAIE